MTTNISLSGLSNRADTGGRLPLALLMPLASEELVAGATAVVSTIEGTSTQDVWEITPDVDIYIVAGVGVLDPSTTPRRFLQAHTTRNFGVRAVGEKLSVLAVS